MDIFATIVKYCWKVILADVCGSVGYGYEDLMRCFAVPYFQRELRKFTRKSRYSV